MFLIPISFGVTSICSFLFFNDTATTEIYTLSLHDALPISASAHRPWARAVSRGLEPAGGAREGRGLTYLSPLGQRYASPAMQALWGERRRVGLWRRLWPAPMGAQQELGLDITVRAPAKPPPHPD